MEKEYQKLQKSIIRYIIWMILFWGIKMLLSFFQIEYRLWLSALGYVISGVAPFRLLGQRLIIENTNSKFMKAYSIIACVILLFAGICGLFAMKEEGITEDGKLEVNYGNHENYYYPYQKISFWGRKPAYGLLEKSMLEEKYGCQFTIDSSALDIGWIRYLPETDPDTNVMAYVKDEILIDDFSEHYVGSIFSRIHKEYDMKSERGYRSISGGVYHTCLESDWSEPSVLASNASILILNALEEMDHDINAPCNSGVLYIVARYREQVHYIPLPFGSSTILKEEGKSRDYYASPEHVREELNLWIDG